GAALDAGAADVRGTGGMTADLATQGAAGDGGGAAEVHIADGALVAHLSAQYAALHGARGGDDRVVAHLALVGRGLADDVVVGGNAHAHHQTLGHRGLAVIEHDVDGAYASGGRAPVEVLVRERAQQQGDARGRGVAIEVHHEVLAGADVLAERADDDAANRHVRARGVTAERNVPAGGEAEKVFSGVAAGADAHGEAAAVEVGAVEVGDRGDAG